jgi:hypothetical protein
MEPLLKGPTGLDYLRNAFANRHGSPSDADSSLPLTVQWLSCILDCKDQEWEEHTNFLVPLTSIENSTQGFLPSTSLRTGGSFLLKTNGSPMSPYPPPTTTSTGMILEIINSIMKLSRKVC